MHESPIFVWQLYLIIFSTFKNLSPERCHSVMMSFTCKEEPSPHPMPQSNSLFLTFRIALSSLLWSWLTFKTSFFAILIVSYKVIWVLALTVENEFIKKDTILHSFNVQDARENLHNMCFAIFVKCRAILLQLTLVLGPWVHKLIYHNVWIEIGWWVRKKQNKRKYWCNKH